MLLKLPPPFTLRDAINSGVLTRYFYHPEKIYLTNSEQEDWNSITKEIQILVARISTGESNYNEDGSITVPEVLKPYMGGLEIIK